MKIPENATVKYNGRLMKVYNWPQEMFDGSTMTYELVAFPDVVVILAISGDEFWYAEEEQPGKGKFIGLFGGSVEEGEIPLNAAKRELMEEAGLTAKHWENVHTHTTKGRLRLTVHYFVARDCEITGEQNLDAGERITPRKAKKEQFFNLLLSDTCIMRETTNEVLRWKYQKIIPEFG